MPIIIIGNQNLIKMSISSDQAAQAAIFLTIYRQAIQTLNQSAIRDRENEAVDNFTDRVIRIYDNKIFKRICNPKDPVLAVQNSWKHMQLVRDIRSFQFSHYLFMKYLPQFMNFPGNGSQLLDYLKDKNTEFQKDINS